MSPNPTNTQYGVFRRARPWFWQPRCNRVGKNTTPRQPPPHEDVEVSHVHAGGRVQPMPPTPYLVHTLPLPFEPHPEGWGWGKCFY